ncbi:MAG: transposase [Persicimonas sp.]
MNTVSHQEEIVISDQDNAPKSLPRWAASFRLICRHLRQQGYLERLEELEQADRRADSYKLVDIVLFLVAYYCAGALEEGLRDFWYDLREYLDEIAALAGRRKLPSSSSVSRFLKTVDAETVARLRRLALGEATDFEALAARDDAMWLDTHQESWLFVDWDPKARLLRQRTLIDGEEYPEARRFGPDHGERGQAGRKRGELKFVRGLMAHAGTGQWLGSYRQPGNGTLVEEMDEVKRVKQTLDAQLADRLENPPVIRIDGEGGEVPVINGVDEAGFVPLVRLKQYSLLERSDVKQAIANAQPTICKGSGTGPVREVFEVGTVPLTSNRKVDKVHRWDNPIEIRLVVSRYKKTEADQGAGKLIDGWRYEMFGTYLPADSWPCEAVVEAYFGRATVENRFASADRELGLDRLHCKANPSGEHLATLVGLWVWNLMVELGDELVEREDIPAASRRNGLQSGDADPVLDGDGPNGEDTPSSRPQLPELNRTVRRRLETMGMRYDARRGIIVCAREHHLVPKKSGKRDDDVVYFRVIGRPCRGCPFRSTCTRSTHPDFRKEVTLPIEQAPQAVEIRDGELDTPIGLEPTGDASPGAYRVRRPGMLPAMRRNAFRRAARLSELEVEIAKTKQPKLHANAEEWSRHRRCRQRLPRAIRRRYYRLGVEDRVTIRWRRRDPRLSPLTATE